MEEVKRISSDSLKPITPKLVININIHLGIDVGF